MSDIKLHTVWVDEKELELIWDFLQEQRYDAETASYAEELLAEIGVAATRAHILQPQHQSIAISLGKEEGGFPLKLTAEEMNYIIKLPLRQDLKELFY